MPFAKGRKKTGGRQKGSVNTARRSARFLERLKGYGFNYDQELASVLKQIRDLGISQKPDPVKIAELKFFYSELKSLLPFMTPKLREKEVEVTDEPETPASPASPAAPVSDEEILRALSPNEPKTATKPRASNPPVLAAGDSQLQVPAGSEEDSRGLAGEQEKD
jgi:hypothetical protein